MNVNLQSLLDRVPDHPLAPGVKAAMIEAMGAADRFAAKKADLAQSGTLTSKGQHQALRDSLVHKFGKDLVRARDPIKKIQKEIQTRREAMTVKAVDKTDVVAAMERAEIRAYFNKLDLMQRQTLALNTKDTRLLEALVTAPPELSGFTGTLAHVINDVEKHYLEIAYPDEIAALEAMQAVVDEGTAGIEVAKVFIKGTIDLDDRQFETLMRPIELKIGAPWLHKTTKGFGDDKVDVVQVIEVDAISQSATYREATDSDLANGVYYKDKAEYFAVQGMAA